MKKVLILGANSYIGNSFQKYIGENYNDQYEVHTVSLRGEAWKEDDWSGTVSYTHLDVYKRQDY